MLTIRKAQMAVLHAAVLQGFEERAAERLLQRFPKRCAVLGARGVRELVRLGVARAAAHGFEALSDVERYLDLMFLLGRDFDADPELPWARARLDARGDDPRTRLGLLCDDARAYIALRRLPLDIAEPP